MKKFNIPEKYKSNVISNLKAKRKLDDPRKRDFSPAEVTFGNVTFYIARHFGFCYGVENAIEIAYNTIENNKDKRIFLLSEMIHNPIVNEDLLTRGVKFLMDTKGNRLIDFNELTSDDIVIIPAFGTTVEIENELKHKGIDSYKYNTTCPFVEKVWNRAEAIGKNNTIIIHGKYLHEETRATFSHTLQNSHAVIVKNLEEAKELGEIILTENQILFEEKFKGKYSSGFDVKRDLISIGVVNQTTMLATETEQIAEYFKQIMITKFGIENITNHFADTRDTLCYATNDNQISAKMLLETNADIAIVVGGYNSSNTSHLVELLENSFPTYYISSDKCLISENEISHYNYHDKTELLTTKYLPKKSNIKIALTSGASCPDSIVEAVIEKLIKFGEKNN
ncbi:MAG TPA: 4-hydroxy-3-methylbut-2-enyl diphosphate reductase [Melioribacteraceae bacterium]|nr:4-hydroxy-3-methylbut-2-enyl diphosphate reductase [Melioribacteraceae bacterium]